MFIAADCESELFEDLGKTPTSKSQHRLVCISWHAPERFSEKFDRQGVEDDPARLPLLAMELANSSTVWWNSSFDLELLCRMYPEVKEPFLKAIRDGRLLDGMPMFAMRCLDPNRRLNLQYAVHRLLGVWLSKSEVRTSFRVGQVLTHEQKKYALEDAIYTYQCFATMRSLGYGDLTKPGRHDQLLDKACAGTIMRPELNDMYLDWDVIYSQATAMKAFTLEEEGMCVDRRRVEQFASEQQEALDEVMDELTEAGLFVWVREPKAVPVVIPLYEASGRKWEYHPVRGQMVRVWKGGGQAVPAVRKACMSEIHAMFEHAAEELQLDDVPRTAGDKISLSADYWRQHRDSLPPLARKYAQHERAKKLLGTYLTPLRVAFERKGRPDQLTIYGSYGIGWAETGRWVSFKPNLQNQPRKLKSMYVSPPGHVLVTADYKSLELYTLCEAMAAFGIKGQMWKFLEAGVDIHTATAAMLFDKPEADVTKDERQGAKATNFGLPGGMGVRKFHNLAVQGYGLDWTYDDTRDIINRWFGVYEDVQHFINMFRIDPFQLRPWNVAPTDWMQYLEAPLDDDGRISRFDLSRHINDGRIYDVMLPSGRRFPNRRFSQAANVYLQGIGAEVVTLAFVKLATQGHRIASVVHDSLTLVSTPGGAAEIIKRQLGQAMKDAQRDVCQRIAHFVPEPEVEILEAWA